MTVTKEEDPEQVGIPSLYGIAAVITIFAIDIFVRYIITRLYQIIPGNRLDTVMNSVNSILL